MRESETDREGGRGGEGLDGRVHARARERERKIERERARTTQREEGVER